LASVLSSLILSPGAITAAFLNDAKIGPPPWACRGSGNAHRRRHADPGNFNFSIRGRQHPNRIESVSGCAVFLVLAINFRSRTGLARLGLLSKLGADNHQHVDGVLTVFLSPLAVAASFESISRTGPGKYYAWDLSLMLMWGDARLLHSGERRLLLLFYIFFEAELIPDVLHHRHSGAGPERRYVRGGKNSFLFTSPGSGSSRWAGTVSNLGHQKAGSLIGKPFTQVRGRQTKLTGTRGRINYWIFSSRFLPPGSRRVNKVPAITPRHTWLRWR